MMTLNTGVTITMSKIPLLTEEAGNWITWKTRIEAKLASIDARNIILGKEPHPPSHNSNPDSTPAENQATAALVLDKQSDWDKHNAKAFNLIVENIDDSHLSLFEDPPIDSSSQITYE